MSGIRIDALNYRSRSGAVSEEVFRFVLTVIGLSCIGGAMWMLVTGIRRFRSADNINHWGSDNGR
jgi:uncharacterized membrane protein YidH (DUF202 family)